MSMQYLGTSFDLHLGGEDLKLPHHEDEIAQSEGAGVQEQGQRFVKHWVHGSHLQVEIRTNRISRPLNPLSNKSRSVKKFPRDLLIFLPSTCKCEPCTQCLTKRCPGSWTPAPSLWAISSS